MKANNIHSGIPNNIPEELFETFPIDTLIFDKTGLSEEEINTIAEQIVGQVPMKRFGSSDEVAKTVLFLASDDSAYILGEDIYVDGGWTQL